MILLIDNYDSFTYNLVQRLGEIDPNRELLVRRNDQVTVAEVVDLNPTHIIVSPGPRTPREAGASTEIVRRFAPAIPILGVCLGHQCIGAAFGGDIVRAERVMHGKTSLVYHDSAGLFEDLPNPLTATRYHSLVVRRDTFKHPDFSVCAWTAEGEIMGLRHRAWPLHGVQFHPESFLTPDGPRLLKNFLAVSYSPAVPNPGEPA